MTTPGLTSTNPVNTKASASVSAFADAISRVNAAGHEAELWTHVKDFAAQLRYQSLIAIDGTRLMGGLKGSILFADMPERMLETIDPILDYTQHPFVRRTQADATPFTISEMRADPSYGGTRWAELAVEAVREGDGLIVPVHRAGEAVAGFNFVGRQPDTSAIARAMLQVLSHAAIERLESIRERKSSPFTGPVLSAREIQCLRHVAKGMGDDEVSKLLGISPRTVRFHLDSVKNKLQVTSRVQAVTKAIRDRIIAV